MTETVRIYINARGIDVPASSTALAAVEVWDAAMAHAIRTGERMITDSRGIRTDPESTVDNGAIFRVVRSRQESADAPDAGDDL